MPTADQWYYLCVVDLREARLLARKFRLETSFINRLGKLDKAHIYVSCRGWPVVSHFFFSPGAATVALAYGAIPCDYGDGNVGKDLDDPESPWLLR